MDNMLSHPGIELQVLIKEKGLTQKAFSSILGKKVSEVNELLKGKRNITIQRDYLLHQTLGTPIKYWILKQIDYDYSLLDIEEEDTNNNPGSASMTDQNGNREQNENVVEPGLNGTEDAQDSSSQAPQNNTLSSSGATAKDLKGEAKEPDAKDSSSSLHSSSEGQKENKDDEDLKNRAKIFRTF